MVVQTPADASRLPIAKQVTAVSPKARLVLQDPLAFDQATQPALRASRELIAEPAVAGLEREQARNLWESLSLEPDKAQARQAEHKQLLLGAENTAREAMIAKTKALELQAQLVKAQDERWNHPVVYAGAAALVGVAAMWILERRQRVKLQLHKREILEQQSPSLVPDASMMSVATSADAPHSYLPQQGQVFLLEDSPDLANEFATDHLGSSESQRLDLTLPNSEPVPVVPSVPLATAAMLKSGNSMIGEAAENSYDEEAQEAFEQELLAEQLSASLHANVDQSDDENYSRSSLQMPAQGEQSTMEYLLELRTVVSGLCALGRHDGAMTLLEEHIAENSSTCAWVYLEHLNICAQQDLRQEFEAMCKRYLQQFNCAAPSWHEHSINMLSLDSYSQDVNELCIAWSQGATHARSVLVAWLAGPMQERKNVQLPALHDLFDLYELLEYVDVMSGVALQHRHADLARTDQLPSSDMRSAVSDADESEFVPTVSLLDLDYEFSSEVTLVESQVQQSEKAVTVVKPGNFSVDFNVAGTQMGALASALAEIPKN